MRRITAIAATALCLLLLDFIVEDPCVFAEQRPTWQRLDPIAPSSQAIDEFVEVSDRVPVQPSDFDTPPYPPTGDFIEMLPEGDESCAVECEACECCDDIESNRSGAAGHSGWILDLGASALHSEMAVAQTDAWPSDFGPAGRLTLGYEWPSGLGVRAQAWQYSVEGEVQSQSPLSFYYLGYYSDYYLIPGALNRPLYYSYAYSRPIEISAATVYLDVFKNILSRHGEVTLGMGPAFANLEFSFPPAGDGMQFYGGGVTAFGQGFLRFVERGRWKMGLTGQTRATLLAGSWDIASPSTESEQTESMSIFELSVGPELRYRVGATTDRYVFLRTVAEFQQWRSDGMGPIAGDTLALQGASMNFGVLW